jgi:hypothetical protein
LYDYIKQKLDSYGLTTFNQNWSSTGRNVYGVQTGTDFPNQKYIICAHYDDMPSGSTAPGADDNASGTAAVIEAARILSNYSFPFTIIYALWDEEEQGLVGSDYYATQAANQNDSILGVINLDMIAWDSDNDDIAEIHTRSVGSSYEIKDKMVDINTTYNIGLTLQIDDPGTTASDHASFWFNGYGAVLLIEDFQDFNAYYHTTNDKIQYFNQPYYHKMAKLAIGTLATFSLEGIPTNITGIDIVEEYYLQQNYPNPFNPSTKIKYQIPETGFVSLKVIDVLGNEVVDLVNENKSTGSYEVKFDASDLPTGVYFYTLRAGDFVNTKKMLLIK